MPMAVCESIHNFLWIEFNSFHSSVMVIFCKINIAKDHHASYFFSLRI